MLGGHFGFDNVILTDCYFPLLTAVTRLKCQDYHDICVMGSIMSWPPTHFIVT